MRIARSTYYAVPGQSLADAAVTEQIGAICAEFPAYGYRRMTAQLRHDAWSSTTSVSCG